MACNNTVQNTINWTMAYAGWRELNLGVANEPAITNANVIAQTIISPPFCWNWNRATTSFVVSPGTQDYAERVANFGFIEKASYIPAASIGTVSLTGTVATYQGTNSFVAGDTVTVTGVPATIADGVFNITGQTIASATDTYFTVIIGAADVGVNVFDPPATAVSGDTFEIPNIADVLGSGNEAGTPNFIAPQIDNNQDLITFRVLPVPNQYYQVNVVYQKKRPMLITSLSNNWSPIPDHYAYIYEYGFLSLMMAYLSDPKWASFSQKFMAALLGAAEGLTENQKNIFEAAWLDMVSERQAVGLKVGQGVQARTI